MQFFETATLPSSSKTVPEMLRSRDQEHKVYKTKEHKLYKTYGT